jgi:hypothetical protein
MSYQMESLKMFKIIKTPEQIAIEQEQQRIEQAIEDRKTAYTQEADPLFFKAQRGEATEQDWLDKIAEIKARYPK